MRRITLLWGLLLVAVSLAFAQTQGTVSGEVKDSSGAVIVGATVTLTNTGTNATRTTETNQAGQYNFPAINPGMYRLHVEASGFKSVTNNAIEVQIQQAARADFAMEVGQVTESVEVTGTASMLATESATVGTVIENRRIVELPLNGRNFLQLVALSPNVTTGFSAPGQASGRQGGTRASENISVMGMRGTWNHYTLDGIENTDVNFNLYVLLPSIDALQEFKVQSGIYPAEFGRGASQINVSTKSGTNQFHGALFEFMRNDKMDAKPYDFVGTSPKKQPFKWNQYGFALNGPVRIPGVFNGTDRLFFASNWEGFNRRQTGYGTYTVPTLAQRNGDFSIIGKQLVDPTTKTPYPGNQIPKSQFDPISMKLMEFWPAPNVATTALAQNYQTAQPAPINKNQFTQRLDFFESANSQWFGRYSWTDENSTSGSMYLNGSKLFTRASQWMGSNTRLLSPTTVNELRFGINSFYNVTGIELGGKRDVVGSLGIPGMTGGPSEAWGIPRVTGLTGGYSGFGNDSSNPFVTADAVFQVVDNFSWTRGKHAFRFGGEVRRDRYNLSGNEFARGSFEYSGAYSGDSAADLMLGAVKKAEYALNLAFAQYRSTSWAAYFDDVYRITPTVTLNLGLRWEVIPPFYDKSQHGVNVSVPHILLGQVNVPDQSLHPVFVRTGTGDFYENIGFRYPGVQVARDGRLGDRLMQTNYHDFAPRFGLSYSPSSKWTVRTGFGIFYSAESNNSKFDLNRGLGGRVTRVGDPNVWDLKYSTFLTTAASPWVLPAGPFLWAIAHDLKDTSSMQYLLNVQHEIATDTTIEASYNGLMNRHLQGLQNVNAPRPSASGSYASRAPFPEYNYIQYLQSGGTGSYNAGSVKFTRRMRDGLSAMASYTYSKALDNGSAIRGTNADIFPQDSNCMSCDKGYSAFNVPHRIVASVLLELPFGKGKKFANVGGVVNHIIGGWQVSSIFTTQSGLPLNPQSGWDSVNQSGYGEIRPNATGKSPYLPAEQRNSSHWFDPAGWAPALPGQYGNMARNSLIAPWNTFWDAAALKNFRIREGHQLQFRLETFNTANHPALGSPNVNWGGNRTTPSATWGKINGTTNSMRQVQGALKYTF